MEPMAGFNLANWEKGFGDFEFRPDPSTLRIIPWQTATALVLCDFRHHDGRCRGGIATDRPAATGEAAQGKKLVCNIASELEFFLFNNTYHDAFYRRLRGTSPLPAITGSIITPCSRRAMKRSSARCATQMCAAGIPVESSKGEWGRGQHEINFAYAQPCRWPTGTSFSSKA